MSEADCWGMGPVGGREVCIGTVCFVGVGATVSGLDREERMRAVIDAPAAAEAAKIAKVVFDILQIWPILSLLLLDVADV